MSLDPLLPIAPARVKALLIPVGQIKAERFASFVDRLHGEHVVHLREVSADGRPNRSMNLYPGHWATHARGETCW
jgi:trafficking protein particle complex subunit 9